MPDYSFTVNADQTFPQKKVDLKKFKKQLRESNNSTIANNVNAVSIVDGNCVISMAVSLSNADQGDLAGLVAAHDGSSLQTRYDAELPYDVVTNSTSFVDLLSTTVYVGADEEIIVTSTVSCKQSSNSAETFFRILLDGIAQRGMSCAPGTTFQSVAIMLRRAPSTEASHVVKLQWRQSAGIGFIPVSSNPDAAHASLVVQVVKAGQ